MEWLEKLIVELAQKSPEAMLVVSSMGTLVVLATVVVGLTPSKTDDEWLAKVKAIPFLGFFLGVFERFSLVEGKKKA